MKTKADFGLRITSKHFLDSSEEKRYKKKYPHLLLSIAVAYLLGGKDQLVRYKRATTILQTKGTLGTYKCLHESSCLFEDLATIARYLEISGKSHPYHQVWFNIRNHIRHDLRDNFDKKSELKKNRSIALQIDSELQTNIGFDKDFIKVGGIVINLIEVETYLVWAEKEIGTILQESKEMGLIKLLNEKTK